ncbi:MAG: SpoIIE family protein phosphatase [Prevotella sp.]|nr:SpoIIE family protein phosphatase [Prevotella sp.]
MILADSLRETGGLSDGKAYYWLGYASDRTHKKRMAELYWTKGMSVMDDVDTPEELELYAAIASRLTGLKCTWGEYEAALKVAIPALELLKKHDAKMTSDYINLLIYQGCCQSRFGLSEEATNKSLEEGYQAHVDNMEKNPNAIAYRDAFVGVINICYNFLEIHDYQKAMYWIERYGKLLEAYDKLADARPDYADKQRARYFVYRATALEGVGRKREAAKLYEDFLETDYSLTAEGLILGSDYLRQAGLWNDAADNLRSTEKLIREYGVDYSLQTIQEWMLKKFYVNMMADRVDTARAVSMQIVEHLDSAITKQRRQDAIEEEAVRQKEAEMTAEKERMERQQWWTRLAVMAVLILALVIYIFVHHRMSARLKKAHEKLKVAYDQLEETTAAKERMESELRIARNIQMSMVPSVFPDIKGLDMYASMTPAKEVGGDLYNYLLLGDKLYFCVGDVSGKGVPASLFMAQATRLFLTLAKQEMSPAEICTRMNDALSGDDNENNMFVTFWLGLVDLTTGHLSFCNAGHNPPIIGCGGDDVAFLKMQPNIPIGIMPGMEFEGEEMDTIKGRPFFIYTDGLNEAENKEKEEFTDARLIEILRNTRFSSSQQLIEMLRAEVEAHRNGAEPSDDLTMMCLHIQQQD